MSHLSDFRLALERTRTPRLAKPDSGAHIAASLRRISGALTPA